MLSLEELEAGRFETKQGDIKVNADDLIMILNQLSFCQNLLGNQLNDLTEREKEKLLDGVKTYEYVKNKYIVLGDLRREQAWHYEILKKLENPSFTKKATKDEVEELRNNVFQKYLEFKKKREELQKELENIKVGYDKYMDRVILEEK